MAVRDLSDLHRVKGSVIQEMYALRKENKALHGWVEHLERGVVKANIGGPVKKQRSLNMPVVDGTGGEGSSFYVKGDDSEPVRTVVDSDEINSAGKRNLNAR